MSRAAGLAIGAAILSITVGVLVGLVIHAGQVESVNRPVGGASAGAGAQETTSTDSQWLTSTSSAAGSTPIAVEPAAPQPQSPTAPPTVPLTAAPTSPFTYQTSAPAAIDSSEARPTSTNGTATPSTTAGTDAAGATCPALAVQSSDAAGTTLFCQVDQVEGGLRWRAVVNKGGCLSQSMVGVGADGVTYQCTLDASGRNHWAIAAG